MTTDVVTGGGNAPSGEQRPPHMQWRYLGLVFLGGAVGTGLRGTIGMLASDAVSMPLVTFCVNVIGAFALGVFLTVWSRSAATAKRRRSGRLFWATGMLGGFTTYSGLASDSARLLFEHNMTMAILYAGGTIVVGAGASWVGIVCGSRYKRSSWQS